MPYQTGSDDNGKLVGFPFAFCPTDNGHQENQDTFSNQERKQQLKCNRDFKHFLLHNSGDHLS